MDRDQSTGRVPKSTRIVAGHARGSRKVLRPSGTLVHPCHREPLSQVTDEIEISYQPKAAETLFPFFFHKVQLARLPGAGYPHLSIQMELQEATAKAFINSKFLLPQFEFTK